MLCEFTCGWIGGWILAGCILTAVDGVHVIVIVMNVWIENVRMHCNRCCFFCVSGLSLSIIITQFYYLVYHLILSRYFIYY